MWVEVGSASGVMVFGFLGKVSRRGEFRMGSRFKFSKIPSLPGKARFVVVSHLELILLYEGLRYVIVG